MKLFKKIVLKYQRWLNRWRIYRLRILGAKIGTNVKSFGRFVVICPHNLQIGDNSTINENVFLNCVGQLTIGSFVHLSPGCQVHTGKLIIDRTPRMHTIAPVVIGDNVWLASGVVVSAGVTIGAHSVIGANSVVVRNLGPAAFYAGAPVKKIRDIEYGNRTTV